MSFNRIRFGDLFLEPARNGVYKSPDLHGTGCKIVNMGEIFEYDFIGNQDMKRIVMTKEEIKKSGLLKNDLLFARRSLVESGAGKTSIVAELSEPLTFESSIIRVRLDEKQCYPMFYYYWLRSHAGKSAIGALVTGTNVKGIRGSGLKDIIVDYPEYGKQVKIADILQDYDKLTENNQRQIKLLEETAQRLYKEWFVDLRFPGYENTPVVDGVPEGWQLLHLNDIADIIMGQSPKSEFFIAEKDGLPFHQGVGSYGQRFVIDNSYSTSFTRIAEARSILFSVRAPVGRINYTKNRIVIGRGLSAMNHKYGYQSFLFYLLKERFYKDNLIGNGSIFDSISKDELCNQSFIVPKEELISAFDEQSKSIDAMINILDDKINLLIQARDRLLPKLMSGEIEV